VGISNCAPLVVPTATTTVLDCLWQQPFIPECLLLVVRSKNYSRSINQARNLDIEVNVPNIKLVVLSILSQDWLIYLLIQEMLLS